MIKLLKSISGPAEINGMDTIGIDSLDEALEYLKDNLARNAVSKTDVFSWPNATISMGSGGGDGGGGDNPVRDAFYSTARVWDDGIIAPVDTRQVLKRVLS